MAGGKTFITSTIVAWFIDVHETLGIDWAVQTTAPTMDTLKTGLWKEIHRAVKNLKNKTKATDSPNKLEMQGQYGMARSKTVSPNQAVNIEGMHAKRMLIVIDEAKGTRDEVWDSLRGSYSEAGIDDNRAIVVAISTPGEKIGRFYQICTDPNKYPDWNRYHITQKQAIDAKRISETECEKAKQDFGETSSLYQNHYMGEFHEDETEAFMPPHWLDASFDRHDSLDLTDPGPLIAGIDPAGTGADSYTVAWYSPALHAITRYEEYEYTESQIEQAKHTIPTADAFIIDGHYNNSIIEIYGQLTDKPVNTFSGWSPTKWTTRIGQPVKNTRTGAFLNLKEMLDPERNDLILALPRCNRLRVDIQAQKVKPTISEVVQMQSKDWVKEKLGGKSPDIADAVSMAVWLDEVPAVVAESYGNLIPSSW